MGVVTWAWPLLQLKFLRMSEIALDPHLQGILRSVSVLRRDRELFSDNFVNISCIYIQELIHEEICKLRSECKPFSLVYGRIGRKYTAMLFPISVRIPITL